MRFLDLELLRTHCRADNEDDPLLSGIYGPAAEAKAEAHCDRKFYATAEDHNSAVDLLAAEVAAAKAAYDNAVATASGLPNDVEREFAIETAKRALNTVLVNAQQVRDGRVIDANTKAAMYLIAGFYYRHRDTTDEVPEGALNLLRDNVRAAL